MNRLVDVGVRGENHCGEDEDGHGDCPVKPEAGVVDDNIGLVQDPEKIIIINTGPHRVVKSNECCTTVINGPMLIRKWMIEIRLDLFTNVVSNLLAIKAGLPGPQRGPVLLVG